MAGAGRQVFIFLNGPLERPPDLPMGPPEGALVVAVDGGALHCLALGWPAGVLLGDLDSVPPKAVSALGELSPGLEIRTFPKEKDETDFELALRLLDPLSPSISLVTVLGGLGGRWDMTLANVLAPLAGDLGLLRGPEPRPEMVFKAGAWSLRLLVGPAALTLGPARGLRRVSLLPLLGEAIGVSLEGPFKYPLERGILKECLSLGLSNELGPEGGRITIEAGALAVLVSPLEDEGPRGGAGTPGPRDAGTPGPGGAKAAGLGETGAPDLEGVGAPDPEGAGPGPEGPSS